MSDNLTSVLIYTVIVTIVIAATVLCALNKISATATVGLYGVVLGGHGVALVTGRNAPPPMSPGGTAHPEATGGQTTTRM